MQQRLTVERHGRTIQKPEVDDWWEDPVPPSPGVPDLWKCFASPDGRLWVAGDRGTILVSTDATTWTAMSSRLTEEMTDVDFVDARLGWAVSRSGTILHTVDGGQSWAVESSASRILRGCSFLDASRGVVTGEGLLLTTSDGGLTWSSTPTSVGTADCEYVDETHLWRVGESGIYASTDGGTTWSPQTSGTTQELYDCEFTSPSSGWAVGDRVVLRTTDGGANWRQTMSPTTGVRQCRFLTPQTGIMVGDGGFVRTTTDGGNSWVSRVATTSHLSTGAFSSPNEAFIFGPGVAMRTTDGGQKWLLDDVGVHRPLQLNDCEFPDATHGWVVGAWGWIVALDVTPPVLAVGGIDDAWHNAPVTVAVSAIDEGSGTALVGVGLDETAAETLASEAQVTVDAPSDHTGDGVHGVCWWAADETRNRTVVHSANVFIDTAPPETVVRGDVAGWHNAPVMVDLAPIDDGCAPLTFTEYRVDASETWTRGTQVVIGAAASHEDDGIHTVEYRSSDAAGNIAEPASFTVAIDTQGPLCAVEGVDARWHNRTVTLQLSGTDGEGSGIAHLEWRLNGGEWVRGEHPRVVAEVGHENDGINVVDYRSSDVAGNVGEASCTVKIDTRGPRTFALASSRVRRGFWPRFVYRVEDRLSRRAHVKIKVTDSADRQVAVFDLGRQPVGKTLATTIPGVVSRCTLRPGRYIYTVFARDLAGNTPVRTGSNLLTVLPGRVFAHR